MPPQSRRRRNFDEQTKRVQNRNIAAGVLFLLAVLFAVFILYMLRGEKQSQVHVAVSYVNYGDAKKEYKPIPFSFSKETCNSVLSVFADVDSEKDGSVFEIEDNQSNFGVTVSDENENNDFQIVYLSGHVDVLNEELNLITADGTREPLFNWLKPVAGSRSQVKIVLLDAGQYSRSPFFPARPENNFQKLLSENLKSAQGDWEFGENFWVVVSHSAGEISQTSTPLQSSIFGHAVVQTIKECDEKLSVVDLFKQIYSRTTSYARNFDGNPVQHPLLLKSGVGIVTKDLLNAPTDPDEQKIDFGRKGTTASATDSGKEIASESFKNQFGEHSFEFEEWYLQQFESGDSITDTAASPWHAIRKLETYVAFGLEDQLINNDGARLLGNYQRAAGSNQSSLLNESQRETLKQKRKNLRTFRANCLDLAVRARLFSLTQLWGENAKERVKDPWKGFPKLKEFTIGDLTSGEQELSEIKKWNEGYVKFRNSNQRNLIRELKKKFIVEKKLTPFQAELLGTISQRILPLMPLDSEEVSVDGESGSNKLVYPVKFELDFKIDENIGYDPESLKVPKNVSPPDATGPENRINLAILGHEKSEPKQGVVPDIVWGKILPEIALSSRPEFFINKQVTTVPVALDIKGVDSVNVEYLSSESKFPNDGVGFSIDKHPGWVPSGSPSKKLLIDDTPVGADKVEFYLNFKVESWKEEFENAQKNGAEGYELSFRAHGDGADKIFTLLPKFISKDALVITATRQLGNRKKSEAIMSSWVIDAHPKPLQLNVFPNIKSQIEFSVESNISEIRVYDVFLCQIVAPNFKRIRPDRVSGDLKLAEFLQNVKLAYEKVRNSSQSDQVAQEGGGLHPFLKFLKDKKRLGLRPLAKSSVRIGKEKGKFEPWEAPQSPEGLADDKKEVSTELKQGAMLVFWNREQNAPEWFQFLEYKINLPATLKSDEGNVRFKLSEFSAEDDISGALLPEILERPASRMTIYEDGKLLGSAEAETYENLKNWFMIPESKNKKLFTLFEVFGIPSYEIYESMDSTVSTSSGLRERTGVSISNASIESVYPSGWSFASSPNVTQRVFIKSSKDASEKTKPRIKYFLPIPSGVLTNSSTDDYWVRFNNGPKEILHYPCSRISHLELREGEIFAWTNVESHSTKSLFNGLTLEIGKKGGDTALGKWKFFTDDQLVVKPSASLKCNHRSFRWSEKENVKFTLDLSRNQPPIELSTVRISHQGGTVAEPGRILTPVSGKEGKFEFSLRDLGLEKPKSRAFKVGVSFNDFFDRACSADVEVPLEREKAVVAKPKIAKAKRAKKVKITIALAAPEGKTIDYIQSVGSLQIGERLVPWFKRGSAVDRENMLAVRKKKGREIVVANIPTGTHRVAVNLVPVFEGEKPKQLTVEKSISVGKEGQVVTLTLQE